MINSRTKGAAAEREVFKILSEALGEKVERNLIQTREGGADTSVGDWAIEVKRQEILAISAWWEQAKEQASRVNKKPMLIYRRSRMPWRVVVWAKDFLSCYEVQVSYDELLDISLSMGIRLIKNAYMIEDPLGWQAKIARGKDAPSL